MACMAPIEIEQETWSNALDEAWAQVPANSTLIDVRDSFHGEEPAKLMTFDCTEGSKFFCQVYFVIGQNGTILTMYQTT